jgi:hypothetical protein
MKHISDLFSRYKTTIKPPQSSVTKIFIASVKEVSGIDITTEQCEYKVSSKTIYLKTPSILRSEILRQKKMILDRTKTSLGDSAPSDVI